MTFVLLYFLALFSASFFSVSLAAPSSSSSPSVTVLLSLDDQLPMVARVNQPYSWTFSPNTFYSTDGALTYTTSSLPTWLAFDPNTLTFRGTPTKDDKGYPEITVTAHATGSSTSSRFTICVTDDPAPTLNRPVAEQFTANSSSLSSIFFLRQSSALIAAPDAPPTLRVPPKWSFSIGLESDTFVDPEGGDVFYELRMANGSGIPDFLVFNSKTITLDGVVPPAEELPQPLLLSFNLHASDQEGYTAAKIPFSVFIADHELSMTNPSMPTINITAENDFVVSLLSAADFTGILVDGDNIQPSNISSLDIDVSNYTWLHYDRPSRTLSGTPGDIKDSIPLLPVNLTTIFNQSIQTHVSLERVEPYFVLPQLPSFNVTKGDDVQFNLSKWFSSSAANPVSDETTISVTFEPITAANFLRYNLNSTILTGTIPSDYESALDHIQMIFTAYSHITHSTSHTTATIYVPGTGNTKSLAPSYPSGLATEAHRKLVLGLVLTFGTIGTLCLLTGIFAVVRRCARVADTALVGEEGQVAWSEKDRRWYGLTLSPGRTRVIERGAKSAFVMQQQPQMPQTPTAHRSGLSSQGTQEEIPVPPELGLGLHRVSERSQQEGYDQDHPHHQRYEVEVGGVISKKEFLARIKETVRQVSDKYGSSGRGRRPRQRQQNQPPGHGQQPTARMVIGKPILVASTRPMDTPGVQNMNSTMNLGDESVLPPSRPTSTFLTGSPSASTGEHSIPRRRADFGAPRNLAQVHFGDGGLLVRQASAGSMGGTSFQSGLSGEGDSMAEMPMGPATKPRLVPFTPSTRVPVPQAIGVPNLQGVPGFAGARMASQRARVHKVEGSAADELGAVKASATTDELSMGMHYVRSLGADQLTVQRAAAGGPSPTSDSSHVRSSFASLESSGKSGGEEQVMKVLLRAGERFKFRVPVRAVEGAKGKGYHAKLMGGQALPKFILPDMSGIGSKGVLELSGVPTFRDIGEVTVGVYADKDGACVASVIIEVVGKR